MQELFIPLCIWNVALMWNRESVGLCVFYMNEIAIKRVNDALIKRKTFWHSFLLLRVYEITFTYCNLDVSREPIIKILSDKNIVRFFAIS